MSSCPWNANRNSQIDRYRPGEGIDVMSTAKQPKTALQFSLRSLLAAMTILSVLLAIFVPLVRAQPPELHPHLLRVILGLAALAVGGFVAFSVLRWRVETRGGDLLLRCTPWAGRLVWLILVVFIGGVLVWQSVYMGPLLMKDIPLVEQELELGLSSWTWLGAIGAFAPMMLALVYALAELWWRVTPLTLEIRHNGIGFGGLKFLPWSAVTGYQWMDGKHGGRLMISSAKRKHVTFISPGDRDAVQRLLDAKRVGP